MLHMLSNRIINQGLGCLICVIMACGFAVAHHELPEGFVLEEVTSGLDRPTSLAFAPDGRIFIAEKGGSIRIIEKGVLLEEPFYRVTTETPNERGLDGIVLDPDFDKNHFVYLYYSIKDDRRNKLARVTAAGNTAIPDSEIELMKFGKMWGSWHNGGALLFGKDDKLYVSIGDGTAGVNAPKLDWLLGKILRINRDGSIPNDNPFIDQTHGDHQAIVAYGIRNPYTMAISKSTGRIFFCDVGNNLAEEVNELILGKNYGWNRVEGHLPVGNTPPDDLYVDPLYTYDHSEEKCAVVGAAFYEPEERLFPEEYHGKFFFMDYCTGVIYYMDPDNHEVKVFANGFDFPNNLAVSDDGSLYVMKLKTGELFRISYVGSGAPYISRQPKAGVHVPGESIKLSLEAAGEGDLRYVWIKDGQIIQEGEENEILITDVASTDNGSEIFCVVSNYIDTITSDTVTLSIVSGTRPNIMIIEPTPGSLFSAGDTIYFEAQVNDVEDEELDPEAVQWEVNFHHDEHTHPALDPANTLKGYYVVGTSGEVDTNVFYRFEIEARDSDGLTSNAYVDVLPSLIDVNVFSNPEGIKVSVDGSSTTTNFTLRSLSNQKRTLEAPIYDIVENHFYAFSSWDEGDTSLIRSINASDQLQLGLSYTDSGFYHTGNNTALRLRVYEGVGTDTVFYKEQRQHQVDANWDVQSPYRWDGVFPDDEYSVLYRGYLIPPISATYTLHFLHDGFITVNLDDSIILDRVEDESELTETHDFTLFMEGGRKYPFTLFYEHIRYVARVQASWSYSVVEDQVIPAEHFEKYDPSSTSVDTSAPIFQEPQISIFPNPIEDGILSFQLKNAYKPTDVYVSVFDESGKLVIQTMSEVQNELGRILLSSLSPGMYFLELNINGFKSLKKFVVAR